MTTTKRESCAHPSAVGEAGVASSVVTKFTTRKPTRRVASTVGETTPLVLSLPLSSAWADTSCALTAIEYSACSPMPAGHQSRTEAPSTAGSATVTIDSPARSETVCRGRGVSDGQMGRWADGRMVGWSDGRMVRWSDGQMVREKEMSVKNSSVATSTVCSHIQKHGRFNSGTRADIGWYVW